MNETSTVEATKVKANKHESYWTFTLLTVLVPVAGFILGIVYMTKDTKLDRKLGEHLLAVSILFMIVWGVAVTIWATNQQAIMPAGVGY